MTRPVRAGWLRMALHAHIANRRKVRRADFAVAMLRKEAAAHARSKDRETARYLDSLADLIEKAP